MNRKLRTDQEWLRSPQSEVKVGNETQGDCRALRCFGSKAPFAPSTSFAPKFAQVLKFLRDIQASPLAAQKFKETHPNGASVTTFRASLGRH